MKIESTIKFKSFNIYKLNQIIRNLEKEAKIYNLESTIISLPKKNKKITILRSPHVHKKARDQFEVQNYSKIFKIKGSSNNIKNFINKLTYNSIEDINYIIDLKKIF